MGDHPGLSSLKAQGEQASLPQQIRRRQVALSSCKDLWLPLLLPLGCERAMDAPEVHTFGDYDASVGR
jgi:hypothetical protein